MVLVFSLSTNAQDSTKVDNFKKTDEVLSKVVEKALNVAEKTGDFVIEQAPLLLQEFYAWHIYSSIFFVFAGVMLWFSFKNYKLFVSEDFIIKQNGAWDIDTTIIEPYKIQAIETQQFFWQKTTNIGSVTLSTAGGTVSFTTGNYTEIKQLVNYWLYQVETWEKGWM